MVGEEHTIVGRYVQAPFGGPEDVHLLDRRVNRWSQVVHGERARCELHDNGPVVPIGNHRQDVPSARFGGRDDAHLQDVDLRPGKGACQLPASREETFQASSPGPGRYEDAVGEVNSLSDAPRRRPGGRGRRVPVQGVLLLVALLPRRRPNNEDRGQLLFVDGATRLTGPNPVIMNRRSIFNEKEAVEAGAHGRRGGCVHVELSRGDARGTANREGHPRPFLRKSPETADVREGPQDDGRTGDRTGAPQWRVRE